MNRSAFIAIFAGTLLATARCPGGLVTYTNQADWLAAVDASTLQGVDFNGFGADVRFVDSPVDAGPFTLKANKSIGSPLEPNRIDVSPFFPSSTVVDDTPYAYILVEGDNQLTVTMTFDNPVIAFGADFKLETIGESLDLMLNGPAGSPVVEVPDADGFFGFVFDSSNLVDSIVFQARRSNGTDGGEGFGLDNVVLATEAAAVPEPPTFTLAVLALIVFPMGMTSRLAGLRVRENGV